MFALMLEAGYEQRTSHNVRTPLGALDVNILWIDGLQTQAPRALMGAPKAL